MTRSMCVTTAHGGTKLHDSPCTTAAEHRATLRANGIEHKPNKSVMSPPTNLPQQIPDVPAGHYGQPTHISPVFKTADNALDGFDVSGDQGPTLRVFGASLFSKSLAFENGHQAIHSREL
jgi:hypothetical protein